MLLNPSPGIIISKRLNNKLPTENIDSGPNDKVSQSNGGHGGSFQKHTTLLGVKHFNGVVGGEEEELKVFWHLSVWVEPFDVEGVAFVFSTGLAEK